MIKRLLAFYRKKFWTVERLARFNGVKIGVNCDIQDVIFGSEPYLLSIGSNVVVAAGSVVTKSVPAGAIVAGNPAKVVSNVDAFLEKMITYDVGTKGMTVDKKKAYLLSLPNSSFIKK